jgi:hypothetical protein
VSILDVVKLASPKIGINRPTQLIADTGPTSIELQSTLAEVARMIVDRYDWATYKKLGTFTGDGVALAFNKPTDYLRMLKNGSLWPSGSVYSPLTHYVDSDEWLQTIVQNFTPVIGGWTILNNQFNISMGGQSSPLALGDTVQFYYMSNLLFADAGGTPKAAITADTDVFRLDERLLKLGLIYKWKSDNGRPYGQDISDFEDALAIMIGADKGSKILHMGRRRTQFGAEYALPFGPIVP